MDGMEKINELINGFGLIAEVTKIQYDAFTTAGFSHDDALCLTQACLKHMMDNALATGQKDDGEDN